MIEIYNEKSLCELIAHSLLIQQTFEKFKKSIELSNFKIVCNLLNRSWKNFLQIDFTFTNINNKVFKLEHFY